MASIILPLVQHGNDGPVEEPGAFGSLTHREALPILFTQHKRFDQRSFFSSASSGGLEANRLIAGHGQDVGVLMLLPPGAQVQVAAIDRIGHDPLDRNRRLEESAQASGPPVPVWSGSAPTPGCWRPDADR